MRVTDDGASLVERNARLAEFGRLVLVVMADDGPDEHDRIEAVRRHATALGLAEPIDGADDRDPWIRVLGACFGCAKVDPTPTGSGYCGSCEQGGDDGQA